MTHVTDEPVFHIEPRGRLASRIIQYMVALTFQSLVPGSKISNVQIPEWDIDHPPKALPEPTETVAEHDTLDLAGLAERAGAGEIRSIVYSGYGRRMEYFLDLDFYRSAFFRKSVVSRHRFDERYLVCHVRAGEVLYGRTDPNHPLTPIEFYADIVEETGLIPVFMGQTASGTYMARLRARFPQAVVLEPGDIVSDFETIRHAKNIVVSISTHGWLAAWLSHADRIFMAVNGLHNPAQYPAVNLLPFGDARYRFYLFPINYAVPLEHHAAAHRRIAPLWQKVGHNSLRQLIEDAPRFDPTPEQMLEAFDPVYYLATNGDVARALGADNLDGALYHYLRWGMQEQRIPFQLSKTWYAARYPIAAVEVARGDYSSFAHHYVAVGRERGYHALPDATDSSLWPEVDLNARAPVVPPPISMLADEVISLEAGQPLDENPKVSLGDSFAKLLSPHAVQHFVARKDIEPLRAYRLHDVMLDASLMALFSGYQPIPETLYMVTQHEYEYARMKPLYPEQTASGQHYILGCNRSAHNYYHWMAQSLPAIDWGVRNRRHSNVTLAVPSLRPWQEEALALLGHADVPRLTLQSHAHYDLASAEYAEFLGDRLIVGISRAAAATYTRLRLAVAPAVDGSDEIYVARTDATNRVMVNEADLIAMLERQGVRVVVPGLLSVTKQIAIFRRARLVIGGHGAGLSNIIGCEPGSQIYELLPSHYPNWCFNRLAQSCGLHYWADVFPTEQGEGGPHERSWRINLDTVATRLEVIRARITADEAHA
jgi:capsular polysaccharide biosynthesis protein